MWEVLKANLSLIKAIGLGVLIGTIFLSGMHYEKLIWIKHEKEAYEEKLKSLQEEVEKQNQLNLETRSKLDSVKKSYASRIVQLAKEHETPHTNCIASPASLRILRDAIKSTQDR